MKLHQLAEAAELITGTNCANCSWADKNRRAPEKDELDAQNGIKLDKKDYPKAKTADLVTLPGKRPSVKVFTCHHPKLKLNVTTHNCCAYWDNPGCLRAFNNDSSK